MAVSLYRYLPTFLRLRDMIYSGTDGSSESAILEKIVEVLGLTFDEYDQFIQDLLKLQDPDECDPTYFMHISFLLGTLIPGGMTEAKARFIIRNLVSFYKTKGTQHSWRTSWQWQNEEISRIQELWKSIPREIGEYSLFQDAVHPLKSARIEFASCIASCESYCESACESVCEVVGEIGQLLSRTDAEAKLALVDELRPIHVLLRKDVVEQPVTDSFPSRIDTIGHFPIASGHTDPWEGSQVTGNLSDALGAVDDSYLLEITCVSTCETTCQGCCETSCECDACEVDCQAGSCQLACTSGCEYFCEWNCENSCQFGCTVQGNEGPGPCEDTCQTECQEECQTECMTDVQTL